MVLALLGGVAQAQTVGSASAGAGAGFVGGEPVSAIEVRGDVAWEGGAVGIGGRMRAIGDGLATEEWDEVADWIAIVRYAIARNEAERRRDADAWRVAAAAGELGDVRVGARTIVDGYVAAAYADRKQTGVQVRAGKGESGGEIVIGDVARGTMIAAGGEAPVGPVIVGGSAAIDPRATVAMGDTAPFGAIAVDVTLQRGGARVGIDLGWEPGLGAGAAAVASGAVRIGARTEVAGRVEAGAGTRRWIAAPFGPLYLRLRDDAGGGMSLLQRARAGDFGGVGGAASVRVAVDGIGAIDGGVRARPGLPAEVDVRVAVPATPVVQAAAFTAWMPAAEDALLVGAEAHAELPRHLWSALEVSRQYAAGDSLYAERPVWQLTAWFGWTRSTD